MKIAILISGRIARYESCLLQILNNSYYHNIDLFVSINDKNKYCKYYNDMKKNLHKWLKFVRIEEFIVDIDIFNIFNPDKSIAPHKMQVHLKKINNKLVPYNCLSMYYNDMIAFNAACKYADDNNFEYDLYLKFRSDIIADNIPENIIKPDNNKIHLYSHVPLCNFISCGIYNKPIISDAYAWSNRKTLEIYCNTYNYVLNKIKLYNGEYYVAFECSLTDNIYENKVEHSFHNYGYRLDKNRRLFDNDEYYCSNGIEPTIYNKTFSNIDINNFNKFIPAVKQE